MPTSISVACRCGWTARVRPQLSGKKIRCKDCQSVVVVGSQQPTTRKKSSSAGRSRTSGSTQSKPNRTKSPRPAARQQSRTRSSSDDVPGDDLYAVPQRSSGSSKRRKGKRKKKRGGSRLLPVVFGIVGIGVMGVVGFFAVRFAVDALHTEPPVFAISNANTAYEVKVSALTVVDSQMAIASSDLNFEFQEGPNERILTLTRYHAAFGPPMAQKSIALTPSALEIGNGIFNTVTQSAAEASPEMAAAIRAMGKPFCKFPVPRDDVSAVELLSGPGFLDEHGVHVGPVFVTPPFATNVDSWDVDQRWPMVKGLATGTIRYAKERTADSLVTVSVNGTLRRSGSFESQGITMSGATLTFSGTHVYSTMTNSWESANLKCEIGGRASDGGRSARVNSSFTLKMSSQPIGP